MNMNKRSIKQLSPVKCRSKQSTASIYWRRRDVPIAQNGWDGPADGMERGLATRTDRGRPSGHKRPGC